jgi:hypothetical protein
MLIDTIAMHQSPVSSPDKTEITRMIDSPQCGHTQSSFGSCVDQR